MDSSAGAGISGILPAVERLLAEALAADRLALATDEAVLELVTRADRIVALAVAARGELVRAAEAREAAAQVAQCSTAEWLRRTHAHTAQRCRSIVKEAVRLGRFPDLIAASAAGVVGGEQAAAILKVLEELPSDLSSEQVAAATATLVECAQQHDPAELMRLGWHLVEVIDPDRLDDLLAQQLEREEKRALRRRGLALFPDHHGAYRISGHLTAAEGEEVAAILNAHAESAWKRQSEDSTGAPTGKAQLLADALLVVVRGHAALSLAPAHGGDRPRVTVLLGLDALRTGLGSMALTGGTPLTAAEARRLACDCDLIPAVLNAHGVPLDVGRSARLVTWSLRVALVARDGGCVFPGCDRAPVDCEAHHIQPWWAGGATSLDNLVLLCPRHHRMVEPGRGGAWDRDDPHRWQIRLARDGLPETTPPAAYDSAREPRRHTRHRVMRR